MHTAYTHMSNTQLNNHTLWAIISANLLMAGSSETKGTMYIYIYTLGYTVFECICLYLLV